MNLRGAPRLVIKAAQRQLRESNHRYGVVMTPVPKDEWPSEFSDGGVPVLGAWRSQRFLAVAYSERPPAIRLSVQRTTLGDDGNWVDGITWDHLQTVKLECGFGDRDAIEIYPRECDLVNVANMRHLWILAEPCSLTWRART